MKKEWYLLFSYSRSIVEWTLLRSELIFEELGFLFDKRILQMYKEEKHDSQPTPLLVNIIYN